MTVLAFTDGASRGNPGESGIGIVLKDIKGRKISTTFGYIGKGTNNVAEYKALIACLSLVEKIDCDHLIVHSDSELLVRQMKGEYKIKDAVLKTYAHRVRTKLGKAPFRFEIKHVLREQNKEADELANLGIDSKTPVRF